MARKLFAPGRRVVVLGVVVAVGVALVLAVDAVRSVDGSPGTPRGSADASLSFVRNGSVFVTSSGVDAPVVHLRAIRSEYTRTYAAPDWSRAGGLAAIEQVQPPADSSMHFISDVVLLRPGQPRLTIGCIFCESPSWSPDGRKVAFVTSSGSVGFTAGTIEIADVRTCCAYPHLPRLLAKTTLDGSPAWSPDGDLVAFVRGRRVVGSHPGEVYPAKPRRLHVIPAAGGKPTQITTTDATNPSWSPDGKFIAFDNDRRIGIVGRRGGPVRFIARGTNPAWSPNGTTIAFERGGSVWLMDSSGARQRLHSRNARDPAWMP